MIMQKPSSKLEIVNIDKIVGMRYPNSTPSHMEFTVTIKNIETTPTLYKIIIEYGVDYYKQATLVINRDSGFITDELFYTVELIFIGEIVTQQPFQTIFIMSEFSTPTTFLSAIQKFVQKHLGNLPF